MAENARYDARKAIGEAMAVMRRRKGLSQQDVADRLHTSANTVSRWELGERTPDVYHLAALATEYETSIGKMVPAEAIKQATRAIRGKE